MADKATATTDREKQIANDIRDACLPIWGDTRAVFERKDEIDALSDGLGKTRLAIMAQIAEMSVQGKWLGGEIKNATAFAASISTEENADPKNRTAKSLAAFMSEMNVVAHPRVRNRFPTLLNAVETVWAQEDQAKKDEGPTPVRKWASRKAHALMNVMRAVKDNKADINSAEDLIEYAVENDPDFNAERVARRMETVAKALHQIFVDFADDDIGRAQNYIEAITAEKLIASRTKKLAAERAAAKEHRNLKPGDVARAARPTVVSTPVATPQPVATNEATHEPVTGAYDPMADDIDTTLNDVEAEAAARRAIVQQEITRMELAA